MLVRLSAWLRGRLRRLDRRTASTPVVEAPDAAAAPPSVDPDQPTPIWSLVANIVAERAYGPGGAEIRKGTKIFRPNAKVYVVNGYPGMGMEVVTVIGRSRGPRSRLVRADLRTEFLTNWRVHLVYSPSVLSRITPHDVRFLGSYSRDEPHYPGSSEYRERLEHLAAVWPRPSRPLPDS